MHILIVDDHALYRRGLTQALMDQPDIRRVSEAGSAAAACAVIDLHSDDLSLTLLDHGLPDTNGIALLQQLQQQHPLLPVAILSASEDALLIKQAIDAGALGFIPKSTDTPVLISAISLILSGGTYIPPNMQQKQPPAALRTLTARQQEVLHLICSGMPNKEIAWRLGISEATVKAHITVIFRAYGVSSRTQLLLCST